MGRKDKFETLNINNRSDEIYMFLVEGATNKDLIKYLGISETLFYNWMREGEDESSRFHEFYKTVNKANKVTNQTLERTAVDVALGYTYDVERVKILQDGEEIRYTETVHVEPNERMLRWLLKNRMSNKYMDKKEVKVEGKMENTFLDGYDDKDIERLDYIVGSLIDNKDEEDDD